MLKRTRTFFSCPFPALLIFFSAILLFGLPGPSRAQVDDDDDTDNCEGFFESTVEFTAPNSLEPNTEYEFVIEVTNYAQPGPERCDWILQVDLTMPSSEYAVKESGIAVPEPLHGDAGDPFPIDRWEAAFDPDTMTITWQCFYVNPRPLIGDIREGETLSFSFTATTDSVPTGTPESGVTFDWVLYGDQGNMVSGGWQPPPPDDDDDVYEDDDDDVENDENDMDEAADDDEGGCGC